MVSTSTANWKTTKVTTFIWLLVNRQTYTDILQFKLFQTDLDQFGYIWYQPKPQIHWGPGVNNLHLNSKIYGIRFAFGNTVFEALPRTSCNSTFLQTTTFRSKYFKIIFVYGIKYQGSKSNLNRKQADPKFWKRTQWWSWSKLKSTKPFFSPLVPSLTFWAHWKCPRLGYWT